MDYLTSKLQERGVITFAFIDPGMACAIRIETLVHPHMAKSNFLTVVNADGTESQLPSVSNCGLLRFVRYQNIFRLDLSGTNIGTRMSVLYSELVNVRAIHDIDVLFLEGQFQMNVEFTKGAILGVIGSIRAQSAKFYSAQRTGTKKVEETWTVDDTLTSKHRAKIIGPTPHFTKPQIKQRSIEIAMRNLATRGENTSWLQSHTKIDDYADTVNYCDYIALTLAPPYGRHPDGFARPDGRGATPYGVAGNYQQQAGNYQYSAPQQPVTVGNFQQPVQVGNYQYPQQPQVQVGNFQQPVATTNYYHQFPAGNLQQPVALEFVRY